MKDIINMLNKIDKKELGDAIKKAQEYTKTQEGQKLIEKLKKGEAIDGIPVSSEEQNKLISQLSKNPAAAKVIADILNGKE